MFVHPIVIRHSAPFAVRHERARVGEDPLVLSLLHHARLYCCVLRLWLSASLAEIEGNADVVSAGDDSLLDGVFPYPDLVAGFLLLRCRARRLPLPSGLCSIGRSSGPLIR